MAELLAFSAVDRTALRWLRSEDERHAFDLLSGTAPIAELRWEKSWGSLARARTSDGAWTLKRSGFLLPHITMRPEGAETPVARLEAHIQDCAIDLVGRGHYRLHRAGLFLPAWTLADATNQRLLHIEPVRESGRIRGGIVDTEALARNLPELPLLVLVTWHFIVLAWFEDEAASATEAVTKAFSGAD